MSKRSVKKAEIKVKPCPRGHKARVSSFRSSNLNYGPNRNYAPRPVYFCECEEKSCPWSWIAGFRSKSLAIKAWNLRR